MNSSILIDVKKILGIDKDYNVFDLDIIAAINSTFMILYQLGIGTKEPFSISDDTTTWEEFIGEAKNYEALKNYVALRVRTIFDPPTSSSVAEATNNLISEFEWRLFIEADPVEPLDCEEIQNE